MVILAAVGTVYGGDCSLRCCIIGHFDKTKPLGLSCVSIRHNIDTLYSSVGFKERTDSPFRRLKTEVSYKNTLHFFVPFLNLKGS